MRPMRPQPMTAMLSGWFMRWLVKFRWQERHGGEIRRPNAEIRKNSEYRIFKGTDQIKESRVHVIIRISGFGIRIFCRLVLLTVYSPRPRRYSRLFCAYC